MAQDEQGPQTGDAAEEPAGQAEDAAGQAEEAASGADGPVQELKDEVREAVLEILRPAARQAASSAAQYAVSKGPELVAKNVMPSVMKAGGPGGLAKQAISKGGEALSGAGGVAGVAGKVTGAAGKLLSKLGGGKGAGDAAGWGQNRRMPVQQFVYVSVPLKRAYTGWTEYQRWPEYMHRANQVDPELDDDKVRLKVTEKMWGFTRPFTAEVISQRPDEHIKWRSTEGTKHTGVINFHELGPRLTLIELNLDHSPSGPVEKVARGARFVKRAVRADFHRFQAWIEMADDEELEGWRGTIEDGEIVKSHEEAVEEEEAAQEAAEEEQPEAVDEDEPEAVEEEEPEAAEEEEPEAEEEEPEAAEEEEPEAAEEEEPEAAEEEPAPRRRRPRARQAAGQRPRRRSSG
jgi:uncharacterized membrane protein